MIGNHTLRRQTHTHTHTPRRLAYIQRKWGECRSRLCFSACVFVQRHQLTTTTTTTTKRAHNVWCCVDVSSSPRVNPIDNFFFLQSGPPFESRETQQSSSFFFVLLNKTPTTVFENINLNKKNCSRGYFPSCFWSVIVDQRIFRLTKYNACRRARFFYIFKYKKS